MLENLDDEKAAFKIEYENHLSKKSRAQLEKKEDKQKSSEDGSYLMATFDLQSVLTVPMSKVSQFYYKRKLTCYNLTVYEGVSKEGTPD